MYEAKEAACRELCSRLDYLPDSGALVYKHAARTEGCQVGDLCRDGYRSVSIKIEGVRYKFMAHRIAWILFYGSPPKGEIDHINGDRSDNRIANLRDVSRSENCRNASKRKDNKSGVSGVYWDKHASAWRAMVRHEGRRHYVGVYGDLKAAALAVSAFRSSRGFSERHGT